MCVCVSLCTRAFLHLSAGVTSTPVTEDVNHPPPTPKPQTGAIAGRRSGGGRGRH